MTNDSTKFNINEFKEEMDKVEKLDKVQRVHVCPNCGHCPTCGRRDVPWGTQLEYPWREDNLPVQYREPYCFGDQYYEGFHPVWVY